MRIHKTAIILLIFASCAQFVAAQNKPKLTLDEFFNSVSFPSIEISPDGNSVVIATERADWDQQIFRKDLWLYRAGKNNEEKNDDTKAGPLIQLTQSGHDTEPSGLPTAAGSPSSPSANPPPKRVAIPTPIPILRITTNPRRFT